MDLREVLDLQAGVVTRRQLVASGVGASDLKRMLRRRELRRVYDGVFVNHTGEPTWIQRAWAATLACEPAILYGRSALRAESGPGLRGHRDQDPIQVAIDRNRRLIAPGGVVLHRIADLDAKARWNRSPPRQRTEEAALDVAASADSHHDAVAELARVIGSRSTTAARLRSALAGRTRIARRRFLEDLLADLDAGACSALEVAYLRDVERRHGLGTPRRQVVASSRGHIFRDVEYADLGVVIELDGRLDHSFFRDRDRDLDRDLDAALLGRFTIRLGWGQVVGRSCATAAKLHRLLARHGLRAPFRTCPDCPG